MNKDITLPQQSGVALVTALFILLILTMLALSSMNATIMDERMAGNSQEKTRAFRAAEIGVETAFNDSGAFSIDNTSPTLLGTLTDLDGHGTTASYEAEYIGESKPPRGSGHDSSIVHHQFKLSATATTASGASTRITQGAYQIGRVSEN